jgi:GNAT superfamily N-acetyltransferase
MNLIVRPIPVERARPLRNAVLRPGLPPETSVYPGDQAGDTFHAGAFLGNELVGIASVFRQPPPFEQKANGWRLRGMAVTQVPRRLGVGKALVEACLAHIAQQGGALLWCNARTSALPFYQSLGFRTHGEQFDVPESGPHYVAYRVV